MIDMSMSRVCTQYLPSTSLICHFRDCTGLAVFLMKSCGLSHGSAQVMCPHYSCGALAMWRKNSTLSRAW